METHRADTSLTRSRSARRCPSIFSAAFDCPSNAAGTVSLALGANDDESDLKASRGFRNTQFLITTGPGPVPSLDGENVVFGRCFAAALLVSLLPCASCCNARIGRDVWDSENRLKTA